MLRFNQYPPQSAGDVELTESFKSELRSALNREAVGAGLDTYAYGKVLGHLLAANLSESDRSWPHGRSRANELAQPIFDEIDQMTESTSALIAVDNGYNNGVMAELLELKSKESSRV